MPRKKKEQGDAFGKVFPSRLRDLMRSEDATQQSLGEKIGKTRQMVGYYMDGSSSPDWETLRDIARYFNVSVDWLLGGDGPMTVKADIQQSCKTTGLSGEAVKKLSQISTYHKKVGSTTMCDGVPPLEILSRLIEDSEFWRVLNYLYQSTSSDATTYMREYNETWQWVPETTTIGTEVYPFADSLQEMCVASATIHFGNAVRRVLGWDASPSAQEAKLKDTEPPYYYRKPRADLHGDVENLLQAMKTPEK